MVYFASAIMPPFIESSPSGSPLPVYWPFPKFYTPFLRDELEFLANTLFKFIIFLHLGSSRVALFGLNNLFLVSPFAGFIYLISYLSIDEAAALQPPYSTILPIKKFSA